MNQTWARDQQPPKIILDQMVELLREGQAKAVAEEVGKLLQAYPLSFPLWEIYGGCLLELEQFEAAEMALAQGVKLGPDHWEGLMNHATALRALGQFDAAEERARAAVALAPDAVPALLELGACVNARGNVEEGLALADRVLALQPKSALGHHNRGAALLALGRRKLARRAFVAAVAANPRFAEAHRNLARLKPWKEKDAHLTQMLGMYEENTLPREDRARLCFGLFAAFDKLGETVRAWEFLAEGNAIRHDLSGYDPAEDAAHMEQSLDRFGGLTPVKAELAAFTPVFIVGMPRSGTTLVEQILSSHGQVAGAGESALVGRLAQGLLSRDASLDAAALMDFRAAYLEEMASAAQGAAFVTDKMPHNFRYLGLISAALPEARIVHVTRAPEAVCWSNFKHFFVAKGLSYTHDLETIVASYQRYEQVMKDWEGKIAQEIIPCNYEELTKSPEEETKRLIADLGLEWDERCLSPEANERVVMTASMRQVREKVYQGSSEAWRRYEPWLREAFAPLGARKEVAKTG